MKKLTKADINQLIYYLQESIDSGEYYGNKKQFMKRQGKLMEWLLYIRKGLDIVKEVKK